MGFFFPPLSLLTKVFKCYFLFMCSNRLWFLFRRPLAGSAIRATHNPEQPEHSARPEARRPRTRDPTAASAPRGLASLARSRRARAAQHRLVPVGRCPRQASGRTPRRTWRRERGWARRASAQPRKPRPPGPPRCSAPRPAASSRAPGAGIRGRRGRPELSGGGGGAGSPGSAALLRG